MIDWKKYQWYRSRRFPSIAFPRVILSQIDRFLAAQIGWRKSDGPVKSPENRLDGRNPPKIGWFNVFHTGFYRF
jgi:hypothetical protein